MAVLGGAEDGAEDGAGSSGGASSDAHIASLSELATAANTPLMSRLIPRTASDIRSERKSAAQMRAECVTKGMLRSHG